MDSIRIAHISDLHFGMDNQGAVWSSLAAHLLRDPQPHGIIATGDLVDTPDPALFTRVGKEFQRFTDARIPWVVCAGNHDRHGRGNVGFIGKLAAAVKGHPTVGTAFDNAFMGHVANLEELQKWPPPNSTFARADAKWQVRIFGIDSSIQAKYSAQGFVELKAFGRLGEQTRTSDAAADSYDLLIGLIHHHLLPIAALESSAQAIGGLFRPTVLVNAGTVLEAMATNNVNLVLHGHEHYRNVARFGVLGRARASDILVIGAGSATGADTKAGCDGLRASYNLLELRPDASVWLREMRITAGEWTTQGEAACLLTGRSVREGRVMRRRSIVARPLARLDRQFTVEEYRDIEVHESRTAWPIVGDTLVFEVHRASGSPVLSQLRIEWEGGGESRWQDGEGAGAASFQSHRDGSRKFSLRVPVRDRAKVAQRVELEYRWARSAVLTGTDIAQLADDQMDYFRNLNREAVSIHVPAPLESITLAVTVPAAYAPSSESWQVFVERPEGGANAIEPNLELQAFVSVIPGGHATLNVPFPLPDYRYYLSWPVRPGFAPDPGVQFMRDRAREQGQVWVESVARRVAEVLRGARGCSATVYVPEVVPNQRVQFRICGLASAAANADHPMPAPMPQPLHRPRDEHDGLLGAWYGEASWVEADPDEPGDPAVLWPGEETVFLLPAYHVAWTRPTEPWGILRLGFGPGAPISEELAEHIALVATVVV